MNVNTVQNNNSQSFGMAFRLKGDGAKQLATHLESVGPKEASYIIEDLIKPIHELKTVDVIYDGSSSVLIKNIAKDNSTWEVIDKAPSPDTTNHSVRYPIRDISRDGLIKDLIINYSSYKPLSDLNKNSHFEQRLLNAREIAKELDRQNALKAHEAQQVAERAARIEAKAKELQDLYG